MVLYEISARHRRNGMTVVMFYKSIEEAREHNPAFTNFRLIGVVKATELL